MKSILDVSFPAKFHFSHITPDRIVIIHCYIELEGVIQQIAEEHSIKPESIHFDILS
jgi:hypothetical protein